MRRITIIGNLTKDAEVRDVSNRKAINFSVAVNEKFTDSNGEKSEKSTFYNCTIWRDSNVNVAHFLTKGTKVFIEGTPEPELYKSKDGEHKASIKILVTNLELLGGGVKTEESSPVKNTEKQDDIPF